MSYRLGVDVGGTFTDLFLVNERSGETFTAKVPSTPADQSIGVLQGIRRVCGQAGVRPEAIDHVMHGTTVATNTVLTGTGARCGLVTTRGYRQVLQIARSFVPGRPRRMGHLQQVPPHGASRAARSRRTSALTRKARSSSPSMKQRLRADLRGLKRRGIEA